MALLAARWRPRRARADSGRVRRGVDQHLAAADRRRKRRRGSTKFTAQLKQALDQSGRYRTIDLASIEKDIDAVRDITDCNGCEAELAKKAGAQVAVVAWVQKVSNLILNMNIRIVDAKTGATLKGGSIDIRGNDDQTWDRGLKYLLSEHVFAPPR